MKTRSQIVQITESSRPVSLTRRADHRVGGVTREVFPRAVHPRYLERRVDPEDRLACQLPEPFGLERGKTWRPHETNDRSV